MGFLYGRAGRLNTKNAGFRPGQIAGLAALFGVDLEQVSLSKNCTFICVLL
jgi:hypothetical protein